jgi:phage-related protein
MTRLAVALLIALVGFVLAGCGGSSRQSKSAYDQMLQTDAKPVGQVITSLQKNPPTTLNALVTRLDAAEASVKKAADDLAAAKPPADVASDNAAIVTALRDVQTGLEKVKANPLSASATLKQMEASPAIKNAEKAIADLRSKGYTVGAFGLP